ncbi:MAG: tRNA pseudouridine(38-40) synthase TruA [Bacteroidales bacterium]|nr:tRNA pseudouridine(38-40) synthase TruA [Candidatus Cryptobacteroides fimicaballi]
MRYLLKLSYDGAPYCGWQIQPSDPSVQQTVEQALSTILGTKTTVTGAGRTDTGVNASCYYAHFDADAQLDVVQTRYKLNAILPSSIAIAEVRKVADGFHARFDARRREYTYFLHREKDPFSDKFSFLCTFPLNFEAMNEAASLLLGEHDFKCFEKTGTDNKTSICTVTEAAWYRKDETHWYFKIAADRFLRNMVRAIVGTLLEVGRGKRSVGNIRDLIENGTRCDAGQSVPGNALFLTEINY